MHVQIAEEDLLGWSRTRRGIGHQLRHRILLLRRTRRHHSRRHALLRDFTGSLMLPTAAHGQQEQTADQRPPVAVA